MATIFSVICSGFLGRPLCLFLGVSRRTLVCVCVRGGGGGRSCFYKFVNHRVSSCVGISYYLGAVVFQGIF